MSLEIYMGQGDIPAGERLQAFLNKAGDAAISAFNREVEEQYELFNVKAEAPAVRARGYIRRLTHATREKAEEALYALGPEPWPNAYRSVVLASYAALHANLCAIALTVMIREARERAAW